jgi:hypothetical protein
MVSVDSHSTDIPRLNSGPPVPPLHVHAQAMSTPSTCTTACSATLDLHRGRGGGWWLVDWIVSPLPLRGLREVAQRGGFVGPLQARARVGQRPVMDPAAAVTARAPAYAIGPGNSLGEE